WQARKRKFVSHATDLRSTRRVAHRRSRLPISANGGGEPAPRIPRNRRRSGRTRRLQVMHRTAGRVLPATLLALALGSAAAQSFPEKQTVVTPPPAGPTRAYVSDIAIQHIVDGRLHVVDVETARYVGQIPLAYAGQATLSPDRKRIYVST